MHFFFGVLHWFPAENVLVKNRNNDSCESSFPLAGLQKFSMNESITESKKFLGKRKSFIRSQSLKLKWRKFMFQTISDHFNKMGFYHQIHLTKTKIFANVEFKLGNWQILC